MKKHFIKKRSGDTVSFIKVSFVEYRFTKNILLLNDLFSKWCFRSFSNRKLHFHDKVQLLNEILNLTAKIKTDQDGKGKSGLNWAKIKTISVEQRILT